MPKEFRALQELLREEAPRVHTPQPAPAVPSCQCERDEVEVVRSLRLFHARVADEVENAVGMLLTDIASDVLARELALAPADVDRIIQAALRRFVDEEPVRVRVHSSRLQAIHATVPVVVDDAMREDDAVLELRTGSLDCSLGVRLACVLAAVQS